MSQDRVLGQRIVDLLNELLVLEPSATNNLMLWHARCSEALLAHPTIQVSGGFGDEPRYSVGIMGILNGLVGKDQDGYGCVLVETLGNTGRIIRFSLRPEK